MIDDSGRLADGPVRQFSLQLSPSRWMLCYLSAIHLLLIACCSLLPLVEAVTMSVGLAIIAHWIYSLWRYASSSSPRWVQQIHWVDDSWLLLVAGQQHSAQLLQATVWSWLIVLNFRCRDSGCRYSVMVLPDSTDVEQRRRLRVIIRHMPVWA